MHQAHSEQKLTIPMLPEPPKPIQIKKEEPAKKLLAEPIKQTEKKACSNDKIQSCPFCLPTTKVFYSDDLVQVIAKTRPAKTPFKTELLIIPQKHIGNIDELQTEDSKHQKILTHMFKAAQNMANKLEGNKNYKLIINGPGFYGVPHLHMHFKSKNPLKE